jgi:hypothetical protein
MATSRLSKGWPGRQPLGSFSRPPGGLDAGKVHHHLGRKVVSGGAQAVSCAVEGCHARAHGRGRCRIHYDEQRYLATTGRDPDAQARAGWEAGVEAELRYGCVPRWRSPHGTGSMFATERERREAWEAHRDRLMAEYLEPPMLPGRRPHAWWEYEAGRPQFLNEISDRELDLATTTRKRHEREVESLGWIARRGHLTGLELETLERRAAEARERVGTGREQKAALSPNFGATSSVSRCGGR